MWVVDSAVYETVAYCEFDVLLRQHSQRVHHSRAADRRVCHGLAACWYLK